MQTLNRKIAIIVLNIVLVILIDLFIYGCLGNKSEHTDKNTNKPIPVEVATIEIGPIEMRRTLSGTLESSSSLVIAPKVSGRIERFTVDIGDIVRRGQIVVKLDNEEYRLAVTQAEADLAVAKANLIQTRSALEIANRELNRVETLRQSGVSSDSQYDAVKSEQLSQEARYQVATAQVKRTEAALETARVRLGYTKVTASWTDGNNNRIVAERFVDEGETVAANTPLLSIVELDPIIGVIYVGEKEYSYLKIGQRVTVNTDAFPGEQFQGQIERIAPVFRQSTRQARVELTILNSQNKLKPGMFIRATIILDRVDEAIIVPELALTSRDDREGIFIINDDDKTVKWFQVQTGIREEDRIQVIGEGLSGQVVTLGQQLLADGSSIIIPTKMNSETAETRE